MICAPIYGIRIGMAPALKVEEFFCFCFAAGNVSLDGEHVSPVPPSGSAYVVILLYSIYI